MKKLLLSLMLAAAMSVNTFAAVNLPDGYVQGLPSDIAVMDENGYSPNGDNGELFISIENMQPGTTYTKDISLTNLRTDAQYSIYMTATPNYEKGNVDMLSETKCKLYLDNELIYEGLVNGDGSPNMQANGLDLGGKYLSGQSRTLHAEFVWNWSGATTYDMPDNSYYGELSFIWTFYANTESGSNNNNSGGGHGVISEETTESTTIFDIPSPHRGKTETETVTQSGGSGNNSNNNNGGNNNGNNGDVIVEPTVSEPTTDDGTSISVPGVVKKIMDNVPFIPDNVKTGFESFLSEYTVLAVVSFGAALVLIVIIAAKSIKLNRLKKKE